MVFLGLFVAQPLTICRLWPRLNTLEPCRYIWIFRHLAILYHADVKPYFPFCRVWAISTCGRIRVHSCLRLTWLQISRRLATSRSLSYLLCHCLSSRSRVTTISTLGSQRPALMITLTSSEACAMHTQTHPPMSMTPPVIPLRGFWRCSGIWTRGLMRYLRWRVHRGLAIKRSALGESG